MRRWLFSATVVAVAGLGLLMFPSQSEAQRGGRGGGGRAAVARSGFRAGVRTGRDFDRGGVRVGIGVGGWGRGWGWGPGWRRGWGPGWGWGYGPGVVYGDGSYVYDEAPSFYAPDNSYVYDEAPAEGYSVTQSAYPPEQGEDVGAPQGDNVARVTVRLPSPNATVWFNGARMLAQGQSRTFTTPPLDPNQDYHYNVRVRFMVNGQPVTQTRVLDIRAGQSYALDFSRGGAQPAATGGQRQGREVIRDEDRSDRDLRRNDVDRNRRPEDIRRPRGDNDRNPAGTRPGDVNRPAGNRPGDVNRPGDRNRNSDTNGRSQPNPNPAGRNPNPPQDQ